MLSAAPSVVCGLLLAITVPTSLQRVAMMARSAQSPTALAVSDICPPLVVNRNASVSAVVSMTPSARAI